MTNATARQSSPWLKALVAGLLVAILVVGAVLLARAGSHSGGPTYGPPAATDTTSPEETEPATAETPGMPGVNTAWLEDENVESKVMFNRLKVFIPLTWDGTQSDSDKAWNYVDRSTCGDVANADCPGIHFLFLSDATEELDAWATTDCEFGERGGRQGPLDDFKIDDQRTLFYQVDCDEGEGEKSSRYAWHVPSRNILITTYEGSAGGLAVEIVQGVLSKATWV